MNGFGEPGISGRTDLARWRWMSHTFARPCAVRRPANQDACREQSTRTPARAGFIDQQVIHLSPATLIGKGNRRFRVRQKPVERRLVDLVILAIGNEHFFDRNLKIIFAGLGVAAD